MKKENYKLSKGTLEAVTKSNEDEVTMKVAGLTFGQKISVSIVNPEFSKEIKVPEINELYNLKIESDSNNNTIKSDGASSTMLTAKLIEKSTGKVVVKDAQIKYSTTLGSLSQPQVALQNGEATTQLRSISSPTSTTAIVTAVVASAPKSPEYVGLTGQLVVNFTPDGSASDAVTMVAPISAGSDQGDRFYVEFSGDIDANKYKKVIEDNNIESYGVKYFIADNNTKPIKIVDVYNVTPRKLMFVLDTDAKSDDISTRSQNPGIGVKGLEMMDANFTGATTNKGNFLRDNIDHNIIFPKNIPGLVTGSEQAITFMMSDVSKPFIYGVSAENAAGNPSNNELVVRASESLSQHLVETNVKLGEGTSDKSSLNKNFTIDGKEIVLNADPSKTAIDIAKANNQIIVNDLYVGEYGKDKKSDNRNKVYIKIDKNFRLASGTHGIQIANIGDLAGETDKPQNLVTTQTFSFNVKQDKEVPNAVVTAQSPEQWLIEFDRPVDSVAGKTLSDVLKVYTKEGYDKETKTPLEQNNDSSAKDYIVSQVDENGVGSILQTDASLKGVKRLLIEFNRDWSVRQKSQDKDKDNYWKSGLNPFKVVLNNVESQSGVKIKETPIDVKLSYDGESPKIDQKKSGDLFSIIKNENFRTLADVTPGKYVYVKMSEPVQLVDSNGKAISYPVTPSLEQNKLGANYNETVGLPRQTYRFINKANSDKVVLGHVVKETLAQDDQSFVIKPEKDLEAGKWTLYIEQISDDHGNTSATESMEFEVPEKKEDKVEASTKVIWAAFDNASDKNDDNNQYDYLYVKFSKVMQAYKANGVDSTSNYKFRGYDLPEGSQVIRGIKNVTDDWDGVTIRMPKNAWNGLNNNDFATNMSVASNFVATDGTKIGGAIQFELKDNKSDSAQNMDGLNNPKKFESIYKADKFDTIVKATATNSDKKGHINTIELKGDKSIAVVAENKPYILVNGVKFIVSDTNKFTIEGGKEIKGTATDKLVVCAPDGSILVNEGKVEDKAKPCFTAKLTSKDTITLTFSEDVKFADMKTFENIDGFTINATPIKIDKDNSKFNKDNYGDTITLKITGNTATDNLKLTASDEINVITDLVKNTAVLEAKGK